MQNFHIISDLIEHKNVSLSRKRKQQIDKRITNIEAHFYHFSVDTIRERKVSKLMNKCRSDTDFHLIGHKIFCQLEERNPVLCIERN